MKYSGVKNIAIADVTAQQISQWDSNFRNEAQHLGWRGKPFSVVTHLMPIPGHLMVLFLPGCQCWTIHKHCSNQINHVTWVVIHNSWWPGQKCAAIHSQRRSTITKQILQTGTHPGELKLTDPLAVDLLNVSVYFIINCSPNIYTKLAVPRGSIINELIIFHDGSGGSATSVSLHTYAYKVT